MLRLRIVLISNGYSLFSRPSQKAGRELQTELDRMMEDEDENEDP